MIGLARGQAQAKDENEYTALSIRPRGSSCLAWSGCCIIEDRKNLMW